jgi:hypothetical protein
MPRSGRRDYPAHLPRGGRPGRARLFPDAGPDLALELVESRATTGGVTMRVYRTAGRPQYAT